MLHVWLRLLDDFDTWPTDLSSDSLNLTEDRLTDRGNKKALLTRYGTGAPSASSKTPPDSPLPSIIMAQKLTLRARSNAVGQLAALETTKKDGDWELPIDPLMRATTHALPKPHRSASASRRSPIRAEAAHAHAHAERRQQLNFSAAADEDLRADEDLPRSVIDHH